MTPPLSPRPKAGRGRGRGRGAGSEDERHKGADGRGREPGRGDRGGGEENTTVFFSPLSDPKPLSIHPGIEDRRRRRGDAGEVRGVKSPSCSSPRAADPPAAFSPVCQGKQ